MDIGNIHWDVVSLEISDVVRACDEGLLEPIDIDALRPGRDGTPAVEDFVPEIQTTCGAGFLYASTVCAYNEDYIPGPKPATMADFFDLEKFCGRRGMRRVPQGNLEFALIADGVPRDQVYPAGGDISWELSSGVDNTPRQRSPDPPRSRNVVYWMIRRTRRRRSRPYVICCLGVASR